MKADQSAMLLNVPTIDYDSIQKEEDSVAQTGGAATVHKKITSIDQIDEYMKSVQHRASLIQLPTSSKRILKNNSSLNRTMYVPGLTTSD